MVIKILLIVFATLLTANNINSEKVLVLCPMSSQSHRNVFQGIYSGLAEKGHEITVVTSGKPSKPAKNVKEVLVFEEFDYFPTLSTLEIRKGGIWALMGQDPSHHFEYCERFYRSEQVKELLKDNFDLILFDLIANQCVYGLMNKLATTTIAVSTMAAPNAFTSPFGLRLPTSFVPDFLLPYMDEMSFFERTLNLLMRFITDNVFSMYDAKLEAVYRKHLGVDTASVSEVAANASLLLVNSHLSFGSPKPTLPDIVEFGGAHCRPGKPLPADLSEFISGAKDGLILFSLGSIVKAHELPEKTRKTFLSTFAKVKQRVLWKWPLPMDNVPPNVKVTKWVPQQDILAHPNTKLFVTHGGLLSTQEAIYHGVPMVYLPVFGDQDLNANLATALGIGMTLEILEVTETNLGDAIKNVLGDPKYQNKIQELSKVFRDQPQTPKERAVYWTEFVMRHKGAVHMRSPSRKLNIIQYYSIDSIAFLGAVLAVVLWILKIIVYKIVNSCLSSVLDKVVGSKKTN